MRKIRHFSVPILAAAALWATTGRPVHGQGPLPQRVAAGNASMTPGTTNAAALATLRAWNDSVTAMETAGQFRSMRREADSAVAGRRHEWLAQLHRGVRVFGGEIVRQTNFFGQVVSLLGSYYPNINIDVTPGMDASRVPAVVAAAGLGTFWRGTTPELTVLPMNDGTYRLTWNARVINGGDVKRVFLDATTGDVVFSYDDKWTQSALVGTVGSGLGVIGDPLKVQSQVSGGQYLAVDLNRPGQDTTYNMLGSFSRTNTVLDFGPSTSDVAADTDNKWTDTAVVSAQVYAGYTYDYYKQVLGRSGLNGNNIKIRTIVNPGLPQDAGNQPPGSDSCYYANACYFGGGYVVFGVGQISSGFVVTRNWAAGIDVVAHELSHGVTEFTSNLIYLNESGALNESFSDMMSTAVEFRSQPLGTGPAKAEWLEAEDVTPSGGGIRSFSNPHSINNYPDHYTLKTTGSSDNGGVHTNSNIVNHMYYLAIMGGVNRVSGLAVTGVGFANRLLIEKTIYQAFTHLPSNATFSTCRAATIQAARDLYGNGSPAETALTQAWNAVGVQ